jgi:AcrR family transcriptional regulator
MLKVKKTKFQILDTALSLSRSIGLEALSIGELAKLVGMSKSGLFAHFRSKETLQSMIIDHAARQFVEQVIKPAIKEKRGVERLSTLMRQWAIWTCAPEHGSCPLISAAIEFDDRPGKVKERISTHLKQLNSSLVKACKLAVEEGQLSNDTDVEQMAQEIFSFMLGLHLYRKTLSDPQSFLRFKTAFVSLLERNGYDGTISMDEV